VRPRTQSVLTHHVRCRDEWLEQAKAKLSADDRIEGALLYGSFGQGTIDVWSDIDLIVFSNDRNVSALVEGRLEFGDQFGTPLYVLDSTWNAPLDGAQVNVLYRLESGLPLYVDFNIWPLAMAGKPTDTQLVFEKASGLLPTVPSEFARWATYERQPRIAPEDLDEETLRHARFGMVPIAVKFCVRGERERLVNLLTGIGGPSVPHGTQAEMRAIRERLRALSPGEPKNSVDAIEAMCDIAEDVISLA
jgi:predicted nucleotidyltransferase